MCLFKKKDKQLKQRLAEVSRQNKDYAKRVAYLNKRMTEIYNANKVIPSMEYVVSLIPKYVLNPSKDESRYCEKKLRDLYSRGFHRYDDERIR